MTDLNGDPGRPPTRILLIDPHPLVREALAQRIARQPDLLLCGEAADASDAIALVASTQPDVVVLELAIPEGDGLDLINRIKAHHPAPRVLVFSALPESLYAERALRAGAIGYITKEAPVDQVLGAIRRVGHGKACLSDQIVDRLLNPDYGDGPATPVRSDVETLSDREIEVFRMIGLGAGSQQIAAQLFLSVKTVETYRARIKEKLKLRSGTKLVHHAVTWVLSNGQELCHEIER